MNRYSEILSKASTEAFFLSRLKIKSRFPRLIKNRGVIKIDVASWLLGSLIIAAIYGVFLFAPIVWKVQELKGMLKEHSYGVDRVSEEQLKELIVTSAKSEHGVKLDPKDIEVAHSENQVSIRVLWKPIIRPLIGRPFVYPVNIQQRTVLFR